MTQTENSEWQSVAVKPCQSQISDVLFKENKSKYKIDSVLFFIYNDQKCISNLL